jgi:DNA-binding NarL/FixJ family response regulator
MAGLVYMINDQRKNGPVFGPGERSGEPVSVLVVSAHLLMIKGIAGMLANVPSIRVLGHSMGRVEMMLKIYETDPAVVIINDDDKDIDSPGTLESIRSAISEFPHVNVLTIIKAHDFDKELTMLKIGVKGLLLENFEQETLIDAIDYVASGGLWHRREIMEKFISEQLFYYKSRESGKDEFSIPSFTKRELEIMQMAGKGKKNREIATELYISEKTVKHHLSKIFKKLSINKRAHLKNFL